MGCPPDVVPLGGVLAFECKYVPALAIFLDTSRVDHLTVKCRDGTLPEIQRCAIGLNHAHPRPRSASVGGATKGFFTIHPIEVLQGSSNFTITSQLVVGDVVTNLIPSENASIL